MLTALLTALAAPALSAEIAGSLLDATPAQITLSLAGDPAPLRPGGEVGVYLEDLRPDPRTGALVPGLRYAGDGQLSWVGAGPEGGGIAEVRLELADPPAPGGRVVLGEPRRLPPTPAWVPPEPAAAPEPEPAPALAEIEPPELPPAELPPTPRVPRGVHVDPGYQALAVSGGFAGDGYGSGAGLGAVAWRLQPDRGPGRIEVGVEGLRGQRWIAGQGDEPWGKEPAAGYWLWTRLDTPGVTVAAFGGLGAGVDAEGLALAWTAGVRSGHPDRGRVELSYTDRGPLGARWTLDGRAMLSDRLRTGVRVRSGDLPRHEGDLLQQRADGAALVDLRFNDALTLSLAGGVGGYDLLWADAGPVFDAGLEVRW